jgi:hypothetical protein
MTQSKNVHQCMYSPRDAFICDVLDVSKAIGVKDFALILAIYACSLLHTAVTSVLL